MDIAALSIAMNQSQVKQQASLSVMKSAMNAAETNAAGLIEMMNKATGQEAPHPYLGGRVDMKG